MVGVAPQTECWSANQKVAGSLSSQGHAWGVGQVLRWGCEGDNRLFISHIVVSLPLLLPPFPSFLKINKSLNGTRAELFQLERARGSTL